MALNLRTTFHLAALGLVATGLATAIVLASQTQSRSWEAPSTDSPVVASVGNETITLGRGTAPLPIGPTAGPIAPAGASTEDRGSPLGTRSIPKRHNREPTAYRGVSIGVHHEDGGYPSPGPAADCQ